MPSKKIRIVLTDAKGWVELRLLSRRWAEVLRGSLWAKGDWVECPPWIDWKEAGELTVEGHTVLPPWHVRLVYDALADAFMFPEEGFPPAPGRVRPFRRMPTPPEDVEPFVWEIYVATARTPA